MLFNEIIIEIKYNETQTFKVTDAAECLPLGLLHASDVFNNQSINNYYIKLEGAAKGRRPQQFAVYCNDSAAIKYIACKRTNIHAQQSLTC